MAEPTELALRFFIEDTDLLSALRYSNYALSKNLDPYLPQSRNTHRGTLIGRYFPASGVFTFTGKVQHRYALPFTLKPNTPTYLNFSRVILQELIAAIDKSFGEDKNQLLKSVTYLEKLITEQINSNTSLKDNIETTTLDLFPEDFEVISSETCGSCFPNGANFAQNTYYDLSPATKGVKNLISQLQQFRVVDHNRLQIAQISGILNLQLEELTSESLKSHFDITGESENFSLEPPRVHFLGKPSIMLDSRGAHCSVAFSTEEDLSTLEFFFHWGRYDNGSDPWIDTQIANSNIKQIGKNTWNATLSISPKAQGRYGVTCFSRFAIGGSRRWFSGYGQDDATFTLESEILLREKPKASRHTKRSLDNLKSLLIKSLEDENKFSEVLYKYRKHSSFNHTGALLQELASNSPEIVERLNQFRQSASFQSTFSTPLSRSKKTRSLLVNNLLDRFGIGETVFVTPEGHHAIAGGLAQVIIGLSSSLNRIGAPTVIISPIYHDALGSKHKSLEEILDKGLQINKAVVQIRLVGNIQIPFGPTYYSGTRGVKKFPKIVSVDVYRASHEHMQFFFLAHKKIASRLYPEQPSHDHLRHSIFLSRGALEIMKDQSFGISPQTIITNDWTTAPLHMFLNADPGYRSDEQLNKCHSVHLIHNAGSAYQGRFYVNQNGEDLWPLFGLSHEHFWGASDPFDHTQFNLTAMAAFHVKDAVLTVSKPYAQQILSDEGSDGLSKILSQKSNVLYGISNGIPLSSLRELCWEAGELSRSRLDFSPLPKADYNERRFVRRLLKYKEATKIHIQNSYALKVDPDALVVSFIGRLAEQKGTALLTEIVNAEGETFLEAILKKHPQIQFIIGGPISPGDSTIRSLQDTIRGLAKKYPQRIQGIFDFIPHTEVLEITLGSDLFLMPSRYEPGGISQLEALATGTLVVARNVGGISATLSDYNEETGAGNAFLFEEFSASALLIAIERAIKVYQNLKKRKLLSLTAARSQNDWNDRLPSYLALLQHVNGILETPNSAFLDNARGLVKKISAIE